MALDEEYRRMPPLIRLDHYESCMRIPEAVYCTSYLTFVSDEPSALLTQIQEYSDHNTTHFDHTVGLYGRCMTDTFAPFNNTTELKLDFEARWNKTLYNEYKLKVKVKGDVWCIGGEFDKMHIGAAHIAVAAICLSLVMFNIIGSLYDAFCKEKNGAVSQLFLCFSLRRNWEKLVAVPGELDPRHKRFRSFYGIRAILMTLVITAHSMLPMMVLPENTKFLESLYGQIWIHIFLNGTLIMQTFLQLSALLLVYNLLVISEKHQLTWKILPMALIKRWLRLTPTYGLVLGVTATWLQYTGTGPFWDTLVASEARDCQKEWWMHFLYINNYVDDSHCMPQAWYLAADTQLYIFGVMVFVFCKTPTSRKVVLSILFLIGVVLPGLQTYFQDLDGTLTVSPMTAIGFFVTNPTFNNTYKRGHTNISCYALGLAFGYLVYYLQNNNFDVTQYKRWRPVYWALFPFGAGVILLSKLNYADAPRPSMGYRIAMACLIKPVFGLTTLILVWGMIFKFEKLYRSIVEWRGWWCVGRLSYSAYLLHIAFVRTLAGCSVHALESSYINLFQIILINVVATYIAACIFYLTVETPLGELTKSILATKKPDQSPGDTSKLEKEDCNSKL